MSETEKGDARAQGAFANWMFGLRGEMKNMGRSPEYQEQFWRSLREEMKNFLDGKAN